MLDCCHRDEDSILFLIYIARDLYYGARESLRHALSIISQHELLPSAVVLLTAH